MSLKPPKKSDLDKSWMKARRDKPKKIQPEYHLIITEGTDTEPAYFGAMRDIINSTYSDRIQLGVHGAGDNTLSLFKKQKTWQHPRPMDISIYGLYTTLMIFQLTISIKLQSFVFLNQPKRPPIMPSGQTNA